MWGMYKKSILFLMMSVLLVFAPVVVNASEVEDTQGPTIDFNTFSIAKEEVDFDEQNVIAFKIEDASEIGRVTLWATIGNNAIVNGVDLTYNEISGFWEGVFVPNASGKAEIYYIDIMDAYSNKTTYVNSQNSHYGSTQNGMFWGDENSTYFDFSKWSFQVLGSIESDNAGPTIDFNTFEIEKTDVNFKEQNKISFKVEDESKIGRVTCWFTIGSKAIVNGVSFSYNENAEIWEGIMIPNVSGKAEIYYIELVDANGNETTYVNSQNSHYGNGMYWGDEDCVYLNLSSYCFNVLGGVIGDSDGPIIDFTTFTMKEEAYLHERVDVSFKVEDKSLISRVTCWLTIGDSAVINGVDLVYDEKTGLWVGACYSDVYGKAEIYYIDVVDANANTTTYVNKENSHYGDTSTGLYWGDENSTYLDLSDYYFYVGIKDDVTGIFVSGTDIAEDSTLEVEVKEHKGNDYDKMKGDKHKSHGYYEIVVKGHHKHGHKFKVFFNVPWAKDGELVRICHKKHDGTLQIEEVPAKGGKVSIEVSEFSPFLIEQRTAGSVYNVKFNGNGATSGSMSTMKGCVYNTSYKLTANAFKKKGYTFVGWNTKKDGKGKSYANEASIKNLTSTDGGTVTLYAQWKKTKYKITYKLNGGKNNKDNKGSYYITTKTFKLKNPSRKGYTFKGWYSDKKCTKKVTQIKKGTTGNKTYYAKWVKVSVKKTTINSAKNSKSKQIVLKYKKSSGAKGYEISYSTDKKFKNSVTKKTSTKTTYTIKKLKKSKTYYVRVRVYKIDSAGKKVYSKYSKVVKVSIKK